MKRKRKKKEKASKIKVKKELTLEHYITIYLIFISCMLLFSIYEICAERLLGAMKDLGLSFAYYFLFFFDNHSLVSPTVTEIPDIPIQTYLPFSLEEVAEKLQNLIPSLFRLDNLSSYFRFLVDSLNGILIVVTLIIPCMIFFVYWYYNRFATEHVKDKTVRLKFWIRWKRGIAVFFRRSVLAAQNYFDFLKKNRKYSYVLLAVWLMNTNLMTILIEALAYYLFFVVDFSVLTLFSQIIKLVFDLIIMLWTLPLPIWLLVGYFIFDKIRVNAALDKLRHMEAKNRGFNNSLSTVIMLTGSMGTGKTRMAVDMALSFECEFRDRALELMNKNMFRFPHFDFLRFQQALVEEIKEGRILNWAGCRRWVRSCQKAYEEDSSLDKLFGYDVKRYSTTYNDGLKILHIWEMLENYAQEYFLYVAVSSLIISNLSIRSDVDQKHAEYFPKWNGDFFKRDPREMGSYSKRAHVIDFDLFRLGVQMNKRNNIAGAFEFGVVVITEIGKERGNNLENQEYKKNTDKANPKNDMFNAWMKLLRHAGSVEGVCFVRLICDEQRATSWGADARDVATVVNIKEVSEPQMAMDFVWFPGIFMQWLIPKYLKYYRKCLNYGNARVKAVDHLHSAVSAVYAPCDRRLNQYGYMVAKVMKQDGTLEDEPVEHEVYISFKKDYAKRYSTDCYKDYFADRALDAEYDFVNSPTYESDCAFLRELEMQNSYLVSGLFQMIQKKSEKIE